MTQHTITLHAFRAATLCVAVLAVVLCSIPSVARAQSTGRVTGTVKDGATGAPMKSVTAILRDAADSTAKPLGDLSNESGAFNITNAIVGREYTLELRYAGYEKHLVEHVVVGTAGAAVNVGEIRLKQAAIEAPEVQVTGRREQVRVMADKTVYGVENNPAYTATNVSELLGQVPTVLVDQDGNVSLRGSENVTIMMNDRPLMMPRDQLNKFLQSLPASMVKDIEIRTNPGAQFDAKNQGGIINIVTRRTMSDMFGGNVNAGADSRKAINAGAGLYYSGDAFSASLGGGGYHGPHEGEGNSLRLNYRDSSEYSDQGNSSSESNSDALYGYGQADYKFGENDVASVSFNLNHWVSDYSSANNHVLTNIAGDVVGRFSDSSAPDGSKTSDGGYSTASFLLKHSFQKDHKLSLDVTYDGYSYGGSRNYVSRYFSAAGEPDTNRGAQRYSNTSNSNATIITRLDYENPVSDALKLTFGAKHEITIADDSSYVGNWNRALGAYVTDSSQTTHYLPTNTVYALYAQTAWAVNDALNVQLGVRAERATVAAEYSSGQEIISRDYTNYFPSASVAYTLEQQHTFTLSYRRSLALPDVDALNPAQQRWDDQNISTGNPDLTPEFTNSFQLNYSTYWGMGNMLSVGPYYNTSVGDIERSKDLVGGIVYTRTANFNGTYSVGSDITLSLRPFDWLNFRVSADVHSKVNRGSALAGDVYSQATGYSGSLWLNADVTSTLSANAMMFARNPASVGGNKNSGSVFMNFSLRQYLLDKKLSVSLRVNDPFAMQKWENTYSSADFYSTSKNTWSSRSIGLDITFNFGTIPRMERHEKDKTETKGGSGGGGGGAQSGGGGQ